MSSLSFIFNTIKNYVKNYVLDIDELVFDSQNERKKKEKLTENENSFISFALFVLRTLIAFIHAKKKKCLSRYKLTRIGPRT